MKRSTAIAFVLAVLLLHSAYAQSPIPSSASFDIGFSPGGSALAVVEKAIGAAKSEILMGCYEFTSRDIAEALENTAHRGVKVRKMRFGLDDGSEHTLEEVGQSFAVTLGNEIRQIEAKALGKLRHPSRSRKLRAFLSMPPCANKALRFTTTEVSLFLPLGTGV